jgi:hypothetical protein
MSRTFSCISVSSYEVYIHQCARTCISAFGRLIPLTQYMYAAGLGVSSSIRTFLHSFIPFAERHHRIRIPGFVSTDDIGKVPAFAGQRAPTSSQQPAASMVSGQTGAVSAGTTAVAGAGASGSGKGKEKASMAAPTLRSRRLAAVKQATK